MSCVVCAGTSGHPPIEDDGDPVCVPCVYRIGRIVADPSPLTQGELHLIYDMHGDVSVLVWDDFTDAFKWRWIGDWPGVAA
jgi:hypothetical protein